MSDLTLREDSREVIVFTLLRNAAAYDLTSMEVRLCRIDGAGKEDKFTSTDTNALIAVTDATAGEVTFTPIAGTWRGVAAIWKYEIYFDVEVTSGNWVSWPESANLKIDIKPKYG